MAVQDADEQSLCYLEAQDKKVIIIFSVAPCFMPRNLSFNEALCYYNNNTNFVFNLGKQPVVPTDVLD